MNAFCVGQSVSWVDERGTRTVGRVFQTVPAGCRLAPWVPAGFHCAKGATRDHESYLIRVGNSKTLLWPRVKGLLLANVAAEKAAAKTNAKRLAQIHDGSRVAEHVIVYGGRIERQDDEWFLFRRSGDSVGPGHPSLLDLFVALAGYSAKVRAGEIK